MLAGLDTNVLVYVLDSGAGWKHEKAVAIIEHVVKQPKSYIVSSQVLAETLYVVKRKYPPALPLAQALVYMITRRVPTVYYTNLEVLQASQSPPRYFWDRLLAYTYLNNGADTIITEDEKPYKGLINVENPFK